MEKAIEQIEDANKFTSRLLEHGSAAEVLSLRQLVSTQLMNLINNTPKPDVNTTLEFVTDMDKFTAAIQVTIVCYTLMLHEHIFTTNNIVF